VDRPEFDLASYWAARSARYERDIYRAEATLRLSPAARDRLALWWGAVGRAALAGPSDCGADDHQPITATVPIETIDHAVFQVLRLGSGCDVMAPDELRDIVAAEVGALARTYR
jgi:predicted DNA-binding transcriptional regulator YafY